MNKWLVVVLLGVILFLGYRLREFSYAAVPPPGENADEYAYAWAGLTLIQGEKPTAWSQFPKAYKESETVQMNIDHIREGEVTLQDFTLVKPWFDNPPLLGLITGGYAYFKGARELIDASVIFLRRPMVKLSLLVIFAVYLLGRKLYDKTVGLLAALMYAVIPVIAISSRLAIAENAYVLTFMGAMIFALYWLEKKKIVFWNIACVLAGVSFYFKVSAVAVFIGLGLFALYYAGREKKILLKNLAVIFLVTVAGYVLYGAYFGWQEFVNVFLSQSDRFYGASSEAFFQAITASKVTKNLTDGWMNLAWISAFIIIYTGWLKDRGSTVIGIAFFSYLVIFLIFGSEAYGHYRIPFYPFLVISAAKVLTDLYKNANYIVYLAFILLPFGTSFHRLVGVVEFQKYVPYFRLVLFASLLISFVLFMRKKEGVVLQKAFFAVTFLFTVALAVLEIYFYTFGKWLFVS